MNTDFIVDGLENFANWGDPIADILGALGDIFGSDGLGAFEEAGNGEDNGEGSSLAELSSGLSSDPDAENTPAPEDNTDPEPAL